MNLIDPRYGNNLLDAHALDQYGGPEDAAMDEVLKLWEQEAFSLVLPYSVKAEIEHPNTPASVKQRAQYFIYTEPVQLNSDELARHDEIRALIQGNAKPGKHAKDAFHLVESAKYGRHFLTQDDRLLRKSDEIWSLLQLCVLKPSDFLTAYRHFQEIDPK